MYAADMNVLVDHIIRNIFSCTYLTVTEDVNVLRQKSILNSVNRGPARWKNQMLSTKVPQSHVD
jgi:hypothetical protein